MWGAERAWVDSNAEGETCDFGLFTAWYLLLSLIVREIRALFSQETYGLRPTLVRGVPSRPLQRFSPRRCQRRAHVCTTMDRFPPARSDGASRKGWPFVSFGRARWPSQCGNWTRNGCRITELTKQLGGEAAGATLRFAYAWTEFFKFVKKVCW